MPLATELTSLILEGTELKHHEEMQSWLAEFRQRLAAAEGAGEDAVGAALNVEQMFDFAAYDEELWRMKHQRPACASDSVTSARTSTRRAILLSIGRSAFVQVQQE